jgi:Flp pilus assembly protein TadG
MMKLLKRLRNSRGQSLVELAVLTPVLLLLLLGGIDFGRVYFAHVSVTNAARNGADYAGRGPTSAADLDGIREAALWETNELLGTSDTNPSVASQAGTDAQGAHYTDVTVSYQFSTLIPWPGLPSSINVERTVRSKVAE